jgi:uncharacterized protein (TIGR03067 family)
MFIRPFAGAALVLVAVGLAVGRADNPKDKDESKAVPFKGLEGTWVYVSYSLEGSQREEPVKAGRRFVFTDEQFAIRDKDNEIYKGTFATKLAKGPAEIDLHYENVQMTVKGIFKQDGDTLTLCLAHTGFDRPTKFESPPDTIVYLIVLKRVRP